MWYFKGRRKKYKSPYTGKEVDAAVKKAKDTTSTAAEIDAAVAKAETIPEVNSSDAGAFLRVDNEGKIGTEQYPITTNVTPVYDDTFDTEPNEDISLYGIAFDDEWTNWTVVVNNEQLTYDSTSEEFSNQGGTITLAWNSLNSMYIMHFTDEDEYAVSITKSTQTVDEDFADAVEMVLPPSKKMYNHAIRIDLQTYGTMFFNVITSFNTVFTKYSFLKWLYDNNYREKLSGFPINTWPSYVTNNALNFIAELYQAANPSESETQLKVFGYSKVFSISGDSLSVSNQEINTNKTMSVFEDAVTEV